MSDLTQARAQEALLAALREPSSDALSDHVPGTAMPPHVHEESSVGTKPAGEHNAAPRVEVSELGSAELIETEARAQGSAQALARGLVVASELWALQGNWERALACARDAFHAAPKLTLAGVQLRALGALLGREDYLAPTLESEARLAPSNAERVHAALLLSDVLRYREHDVARASRAAELAHRLAPEDPRSVLTLIAERLAAGDGASLGTRLKEGPLRAAAVRLAELRGGREAPDATPALLLHRVRRHLEAGKLEAAGAELVAAAGAGLAPAALFDAGAAVLGQASPSYQKAIAALEKRVAFEPTRAAVRALAARAVEHGDARALSRALDAADPGSGTFDLAERVVLSLLLGGEPNLAQLDLEVLGAQSHPAFAAALAPTASSAASDSMESRDALLGSALVSPQRREELALALEHAEEADPLRLTLEAELGVLSRDPEATLRALTRLAESRGDSSLLAAVALLYEKQGHIDSAADAYGRAFEADPSVLWLARALSQTSHGTELARVLDARARLAEDPKRASYALLEATLAATPDAREPLLERAHAVDPSETLVPRLGSLLAARGGDPTRHAVWLRAATEVALPHERALAALREVMVTAKTDPASAAAHASELSDRLKADLSLALYAERMSPSDTSERVARRLRWNAASPREADWLLSEALWLAWQAGDASSAARAARALADATESRLARALAESLELDVGEVTRTSEPLLAATRDAEHPKRQREAFERLAEQDDARGDTSSALLWQKGLLEVDQGHLPALRRLEHELLTRGRESEWEELAQKLAHHLPGADGSAYALSLGAARLASGDHRGALELFQPLVEEADAPLLALRAVQALSDESGDLAKRERVELSLAARAESPADAAAAFLRAGAVAARAGRRTEARRLVEQALERRPTDLTSLWLFAELTRSEGAGASAAEAYERLAEVLGVPAHRASAWLEAGVLWREAATPERASACFAKALVESPSNEEAFAALRKHHEEQNDTAALVALLEARLPYARSARERQELERSRAAGYQVLGDVSRRRDALERFLELSPDEGDALAEHARACTELEDYDAARSSWERLLASSTDEARRTEAERALGILLQDHLGDVRGAAQAYERALRAAPNDQDVAARLVRAYAKLGDAERSTSLQTRLIQLADTPEEKRDGALLLSQLYEHVARDPKRAAATLDRTRKAWPLDPAVLACTARFMDRQGERGARRILVDRTGKEAWRKLEEGRLDPALFDLLATVRELQEREDQAHVTRATRAAFSGDLGELEGGGLQALDPRLDDLLAPPGMSAPLRTLLRKTAAAFDAAFPVDLRGIGARPLPACELSTHIADLSRRVGLGATEVFVADSLGARCLPVSTPTPGGAVGRLVVGPDLESLESSARDFLLLRALKLQQTGVGAFARSRAEDTWPMLAALLVSFAPNWHPGDVDQQKLTLARGQIERGLGVTGYDEDVPVLVLEAIGGAGGQLSHLGEAGRALANRAALLAVGNPAAALDAFSALSDKPLAASGPARFRWLQAHVEARELLLFSASDGYADARSRLGLGPVPVHVSELPRPLPGGTSRAPLPSMAGPRPPQPTLSGEAPPPPRRGAPPPPKRS